jgi:hypothetical protein
MNIAAFTEMIQGIIQTYVNISSAITKYCSMIRYVFPLSHPVAMITRLSCRTSFIMSDSFQTQGETGAVDTLEACLTLVHGSRGPLICLSVQLSFNRKAALCMELLP